MVDKKEQEVIVKLSGGNIMLKIAKKLSQDHSNDHKRNFIILANHETEKKFDFVNITKRKYENKLK